MKKVLIVNPNKLFNAYETYITIGTPSYCPRGHWPNPADLVIMQKLQWLGYDVEYIDADNGPISHEKVQEMIRDIAPDWLIICSESHDYYRSPLSSYENVEKEFPIGLARDLKHTKSILYGIHPMFERPPSWFNYIIAGEGEDSVPLLIDNVDSGMSMQRVQVGKSVNLELMPRPDYSLVPETSQQQSSDFAANLGDGKSTQVATARGCPFKCSFCFREGSGSLVRTRKLDSVMDELWQLKKMDYESVFFIDDYFGGRKKQAIALLDELPKLEMKFSAQTRIDLMQDPKVAKKMLDAGFTSIGLGMESYNDEILKRAGKSQTTAQIDRAVANCENAGLDLIVYVVMMLPGESESTLQRTQRFLDDHDFYAQGAFIATPYPTTPMAKSVNPNIEGVIPSLEAAGLIGTPWRTMQAVRKRWRKFDSEYGKPPVIDTLKKIRPDIFGVWREGVRLFE